ncbi:MAG: chromosomal replication initiator protein DnaA [Ignavibacteriae bacterium]|nr:chromosomal replication initiator protein DnaA [Ignavibacteriota bacterium]
MELQEGIQRQLEGVAPEMLPAAILQSPATLSAEQVWEECLTGIRGQISTLSYKTWFQPIVPVKLVGSEITIQVPSQFFYDWLEEHYNALIRKTITGVLGPEAKMYYSIADDSAEPRVDAAEKAAADAAQQAPLSVAQPYSSFPLNVSIRPSETLAPIQSNLNPRYTFDNFIKGDSNQLARAAALAVANNPGGTSFNPLVIYGGTGLGKTHLMHALGNHAIATGKAKRAAYISSEKFTVDFVEAIQSDRVSEFSQHYRSMDLLIVDDIQFFSGKEKTQDNFFHTFNALYQLGKQIVLSSDVPPKELKGLDDRLISRFQCGLTADIQPPDLETRIAILRKKSEENGLDLAPDVIDFIAANVTKNIRELEGCLISLLARASLESREVTVDLAQDVLRIVANNIRHPITIENIQRAICKHYDIPEDLLRAKTRKQEVVLARQTAMYLAKQLTDASLKTIGLHFGGRDHSTVIHACQSVEDRVKQDAKYKQTIEQFQRRIELHEG